MFTARLKSDAYRRFSVFNLMQNCAELAVSENAIGIINHISSLELGLPYLPNSPQQLLVASQQLQCLFYDRRPATDVFDELLRVSRCAGWIGDSGMLTTRVYQQSGAATVDATIDEAEFLSFGVEEAPLGTSLHDQNLAREVTLRYGYQHWNGEYANTLRAFPGNTPMCDSARAAGVGDAKIISTEYILETATASRYLGYEVGRYCQGNLFASAELSHRHLALELYDVVRLRHRMLVGSEDLFQITQLRHDYGAGRVSFTAARLTTNG